MRKLTLVSLVAFVMAVGCGQPVDMHALSVTQDHALGDAGDTVNLQTRVIQGNYSTTENSVECVALVAKLFKDRKALQLTTEWKQVSTTSQYVTLQQAQARWTSAGCDTATAPPAGCNALAAQVSTDGDALAATPQWAALVATTNFSDLFTAWQRASTLRCVSV